MVLKTSIIDSWLDNTLTILDDRIRRSRHSNSKRFKKVSRNIAFSEQHIVIMDGLVKSLSEVKQTKDYVNISKILDDAAHQSQNHYDQANNTRSRFKKRLGVNTNSLIQDLNTSYKPLSLSIQPNDLSNTKFVGSSAKATQPKETKKEKPEDGYVSEEDSPNPSIISNQTNSFFNSRIMSPQQGDNAYEQKTMPPFLSLEELHQIEKLMCIEQIEAMQLASILQDSLDPSTNVQMNVNIIEPAVILPATDKISSLQKFTAFMDRVIDILDDYVEEPLKTREKHLRMFRKMISNEKTVSFYAGITNPINANFTHIIATLLVEKTLFNADDYLELLGYLKEPEIQNLFRKTLELEALPETMLLPMSKAKDKQNLLHIASQLKPWFSRGLTGDQHQNIWQLIEKMENIAINPSRELLNTDDLALFARALDAVLSELKSPETRQNVSELLSSFLNLEQISVLIRTNKHALNMLLLQLPDHTINSDETMYRVLQQWLRTNVEPQALSDLISKSAIAWSGLLQLAKILPEQNNTIRKALAEKYDNQRSLKSYYAAFGVNNFETLIDFFQPIEYKSSTDVAFISNYSNQLSNRSNDRAKPKQGYGLLGYLKFINMTLSAGLTFRLTDEQKKAFIDTTMNFFSPHLMNSLMSDVNNGIRKVTQEYTCFFKYPSYFKRVIIPFVQQNGLQCDVEKYREFTKLIPLDLVYSDTLFTAFANTFANPTQDEFNQLQECAPNDAAREDLAAKFPEINPSTRYGF